MDVYKSPQRQLTVIIRNWNISFLYILLITNFIISMIISYILSLSLSSFSFLFTILISILLKCNVYIGFRNNTNNSDHIQRCSQKKNFKLNPNNKLNTNNTCLTTLINLNNTFTVLRYEQEIDKIKLALNSQMKSRVIIKR